MALTLLDGFSASIGFTTQRYSAGELTGSALQHSCWANALTLAGRQDVITLNKIVFCSVPGWKVKSALERDVAGVVSGFAAKGDPAGSPLLGIDGNLINIVATVDTGCSLTFDAFANADELGMVAKGNSSRGFSFESTGPVAKAWVTA